MIVRFSLRAFLLAALAGCGPSFSPDTYNTSAMQQSNKVEQGVVAGVRDISVSASGNTGAVTGAAAGGIVGSQTGTGMGSALGAVGGSLIGGLAGVAVEHVATDTKAYEYIVRKSNGEMVSVTQKDEKPLAIGQKVLVIGGNQARIVADYTVPVEPGTKEKTEAAKDNAPSAPQPGPVAATSLAPAGVVYPDPSKIGSPSAASSGGSAAASAVPAGTSPAAAAGATSATPVTATPAAAIPAAAASSVASPIATATPDSSAAQPPSVAGPTVGRNDATP